MGTVSTPNTLLSPVKSEFDNIATWKSTLMFTGNDLAFPIEMFIALMDQNILNDDGTTTERVGKTSAEKALNHIPDLEPHTDIHEEKDVFRASAWKHANWEKLKDLNWQELKEELLSEFGLKRDYNLNEKLELLFSIEKGQEETRDNFLLRISMIVCCIEQGKICDRNDQHHQEMSPPMSPPSEAWVELLVTVGLLNAAHGIPFLLKKPSTSQGLSSHALSPYTSRATTEKGCQKVVEAEIDLFSGLPKCIIPPINELKQENQTAYEELVAKNHDLDVGPTLENEEEYAEFNPSFLIRGEVEDDREELSLPQEEGGQRICKRKKYSCRVCGKLFKFKRNEKQHRFLEHSKDNQCYICNLFYKSLSDRKDHKSKLHKNGKLCEICGKEFESPKDVENHQIELHQGRQFRCSLCSSEMMYDAINQHFLNVHCQGRTKIIR